LNFLVAFGPGFLRQRVQLAKVTERRSRLEETMRSGAAFFHQCHVCKKTEVDDPALDFRVTADGDEICNVCREAQAAVPGPGVQS